MSGAGRSNGIGRQQYVCPQDKTRVAQKHVPSRQPQKPNSIHTAAKQNQPALSNAQPVQPMSIKGQKSFGTKTTTLLNKTYNHKTKLLDIAQSNLGLVEVTPEEYAKLTPEQQKRTQMKIVGAMGGGVNHQWCAYTVSYMAKQVGMNIGGSKAQVSQFISWAQKNGTYRAINSNKISANNMITERESRAKQIEDQLPKMHEGDFIIWKNDYATRTDIGIDTNQSSHIGIIESVDTKPGIVTVIEGNANESYDPAGPVERVQITSKNKSTLGVNGNQIEDEYQEVNRRDGLIRKQYTVQELANFGYSGFIDNSKIVK